MNNTILILSQNPDATLVAGYALFVDENYLGEEYYEVTVNNIKKDGLTLKAANPSYEDKFFDFNEVEQLLVRIIGRVVFCKNYY